MKELIEIYHCDICDNESDPELMIHTPSGKDVCAGCLEKLVDEHFSREQKYEEILESACAKEPMQSKKKNTGVPRYDTKLTQKDIEAIRKMRDEGATIKQIKDIYHIGYNKLTKIVGKRPGYDWGKAQALRDAGWTVRNIAIELGCSDQAVANHTTKPEEKAKKQHEWVDYDIARLG